MEKVRNTKRVQVMRLSPVALLSQEAEVHRTHCGDGSLVWRRWGSGPPLVLLHGGSGSWMHWVKTIPALREDYSVWVVDLPGLGDSAMPPDPHTPATCAAVVAEGFRQLFTAGPPVTMICFSFGCHVGTLVAAELNDHLSSLFIIGSAALGLGRAESISLPKERSGMDEDARLAVHRDVLANLMFASAENIDDTAVEVQVHNIANARFRSREFADTADVRDGLARISVPVKSIWGSRDVVAHPDIESCLDALRLHHPELQYRIIEDAGHWVMYEAADEFNGALRELLST